MPIKLSQRQDVPDVFSNTKVVLNQNGCQKYNSFKIHNKTVYKTLVLNLRIVLCKI